MDIKKTTYEILPSANLYSPEEVSSFIEEKIENKGYRELKSFISDMHAPDIAELFYDFATGHQMLLFRLLPKELAAEVFTLLDADTQRRLIDNVTDTELSEMLDELEIDDTVGFLEEMPAVVVKRILRSASHEDRVAINAILRYPKYSAGSIMTTEYIRFLSGMNVGEALLHIRRVGREREDIHTGYVTDENRRILGVVTVRDLLISEPETALVEIMDDMVILASTHDDREEVSYRLNKYGLYSMPVADSEGRLVGVITLDDALDVIKEESEEDFAKMAALTPVDKPYLKTSVISLFFSRIPWLLFLMLTSTLSSAILSGFEGALPAVLLLFVPMIMGTGGNSGGQSSVTVTRAISLGEIEFSDTGKVFFKELRVGAMCALALSTVTFVKVLLIDMLLLGNSAITITIALVISLSLGATVLAAKMIGATLPILAKKIGLDPAVMASPLITTLVDAISLVVYFLVARSILTF